MLGEQLSVADFMGQPASWKQGLLGAHSYFAASGTPLIQLDRKIPCINVPMQCLSPGVPSCEVWHGSGRLETGRSGDIHYRHDGNVLFGVIEMQEAERDGKSASTPLQQATESAYRQIFGLLDTLGYPHLFRFWNYIADINEHSYGLERYRQFNLGRQDALVAHGRDVGGNVSAACALGIRNGPLTVGFLAGQAAPVRIENPRQVNAYDYPEQYGPRSPVFSRASLVRQVDAETLFVSGTASIVGHVTMHASDVAAQTVETMTNIQAVLDEVNHLENAERFDLPGLHYKVYVRHPEDLDRILPELSRCVGQTPKAIYLQADVCRQELLLEIEAHAAHRLGQAV